MLWLLDLTINFIVEWMITRWEEKSFNGTSFLRLLMFLKPTAEHFIMFSVDQSISRVSLNCFKLGRWTQNLDFIKLLWEYFCKGLWKWVILERTVKHHGPVKLHKLANISSFFAPTLVNGVLVILGVPVVTEKAHKWLYLGLIFQWLGFGLRPFLHRPNVPNPLAELRIWHHHIRIPINENWIILKEKKSNNWKRERFFFQQNHSWYHCKITFLSNYLKIKIDILMRF